MDQAQAITSTMQIATIPASSVMLSMDQDGSNIKIYWREVEKQAAGSDHLLMPVAKALLAVRAGNYQSIK